MKIVNRITSICLILALISCTTTRNIALVNHSKAKKEISGRSVKDDLVIELKDNTRFEDVKQIAFNEGVVKFKARIENVNRNSSIQYIPYEEIDLDSNNAYNAADSNFYSSIKVPVKEYSLRLRDIKKFTLIDHTAGGWTGFFLGIAAGIGSIFVYTTFDLKPSSSEDAFSSGIGMLLLSGIVTPAVFSIVGNVNGAKEDIILKYNY